ncbi:ferritin-like domain-containing protein [Azospirillum rugosum]|uniref:Ferritin-like protein n=1 Tax=Azospirillum rugosum TaxID=416170 RepID=A0ABS4SK25_9PROT|nr:ferritin-like domain-containing protein [Azospirillum rugosum]MBP2292911.1 ferritin-like protein [Azospirillum rugosum]MDQ0529337.1 ferritin-like protein [Azospirillum rugosum]
MPLHRDMTPEQAVMAVNTLLDLPEDNFPLTFDSQIPRIRELFHSATKNQWDPRTDIDWDKLDLSPYSEEQIFAARQYWSRRAWSEYGAISESPALQIRFCEEKRPPDMQLFFTIRSQEEARHAEVCFMMAEKLGGYLEKPVQELFQGSVATHGVRKAALDPEVPLEAIIAALVCAAEEIAFDVFRHLVEITRDPVARQICRAIMRDEVRHCAFGWHFLEHQVTGMTPEQRKVVETAVITMIEKVELNGYHSAWLAPENPASRAEVEADRLTWEAGLGATVEEVEKPVFVASIVRIRERMQALGITLPTFHHDKIGAF